MWLCVLPAGSLANNPRGPHPTLSPDPWAPDPASLLRRTQALLAVDNELTFNEAIIEEREQAINEISGQIGEVHQIFQDLAVLVNDQGEQLNDIEANITRCGGERGSGGGCEGVAKECSERGAKECSRSQKEPAGCCGVLAAVLVCAISLREEP